MKKLVIILAVLMMVAGAAVSVMKTMELGPFAPSVVVVEEGGKMETKQALDDPPRFVDVEPLNIPVFHEDRVAATVQIQLKLEAIGEENEEQIIRLLPRISDAFLRDMHAFIPRLLKKEERINVAIIKKRLEIISERLVGPDLIDNILVQSISDSSSRTRKKSRR